MSRWVDFESLFNFRDVGALTGRPGVLYRSDALSNLREEDRPRYQELGVHTVIDLRRPEEITAVGRAPEWACTAWHNITVRETTWPVSECEDRAAVSAYLADVYVQMEPGDLVAALTVLARETTGTAVVHCMGGRDRTGVLIAVLLELLGVPDEEIAADYTETERFTQRWLAWKLRSSGEQVELPANILHTPPEAMLLYLERIRETYGSVRDYLVGAGLDPAVIDALRARLAAG